MTYWTSRAARADIAVATVLVLSLTGVHYVRRTWLPAGAPIEVLQPSRDRTLPGKSRIRARRRRA